MHTEIMRSLAIRHAPLFDQPHSLKLELACKLPSLHDAPPVPSKHLTRCLRNRVQANRPRAVVRVLGRALSHSTFYSTRDAAWPRAAVGAALRLVGAALRLVGAALRLVGAAPMRRAFYF